MFSFISCKSQNDNFNEHTIRPVYYTGLYTQSPRSGSFIFKIAPMLQISRVFPHISRLGSAKAVQCTRPGPKIGDKSQEIPHYSLVCPRGQPPGMAADKCIGTARPRQYFFNYVDSVNFKNCTYIDNPLE